MVVPARRAVAVTALSLLAVVLLILLDRQHALTVIRLPADRAAATVERVFSSLALHVPWPTSQRERELEAQIAQLQAERDRLLAENAQLKEVQREVDQLQAQLGFQQHHPELRLVPARVIAYDPDATQQVIIIDRGTNVGLQVGLPVVSPNFLVGIVTAVETDRARVTLLTDPSMRLGARLEDTGAEGLLYGEGPQGGGRLELRHLDPQTPVHDGELVVTSGRTAHIPAGLVIGSVYGGSRELAAGELRLAVRPLVDFRALRSVSVILSAAGSS